MQQESDAQLLREYAECGAERAFTEIVARHTNLVYSAALRQVESPDIAAEVAQRVFISLARGAQPLSRKLAKDASLAGWLCRSARNISLNLRRDEFRRHSRERQAMENLDSTPGSMPDWENLRSILDEVMSALSETDYDALVMRFFKNQDLRSVGLAIGVSNDTAQKRISRALDKLRDLLSERGVTTSAATLSIVISANAVQAAPVGLAVTISTAAALAGTTIATSATATAIVMTTLQKTLVAATIAVLAGAGIYEARQASKLRDQVQTLQQQQALVAEQNERFQLQTESMRKHLAQAQEEVSRFRAGTNQADVLRLRSEVGMLRRATNELAKAMQDNQRPAEQSLQLTPQDMFKLRRLQTSDAMSELLTALNQYIGNHGGGYPMNLDDLKNSTGLSGTNFAGGLGLSDFMVLNPPHTFNGKELILRNRFPIENPDGTSEWVYGGLDTNDIPVTITMGAQFGN